VVKQEPVPPVTVTQPPAGSPGEAVPQAASPLAGAAPEVGVAAKRAQRHHLEITATETSWVRVVADGIDAKEALLHKGDKIVMDADTLLDILLGNAGGVEMKYNGERLAPGKKGGVLKLTIPEDAPPAPPATPRKQRMDSTPPTDNTETPAPKPAR
jgi:cytoskeleton protein RodZ